MIKKAISITIEKDLLKEIDLYLIKVGLGSNRSGLIEEAVKLYLKVKNE